MNDAEFKSIVGELRDLYGEKAFNPRLATVIWRIFAPLSRAEASQVVEQCAMNCRGSPTPAQIKQIAMPWLQKAWDRRRLEDITNLGADNPCPVCGHFGVVSAFLRADPRIEYTFGCIDCSAYQVRRLKAPPLWNEAIHAAKYVRYSLRWASFEAATKARDAAFAANYPKKPAPLPETTANQDEILAMLGAAGAQVAKKLREDP